MLSIGIDKFHNYVLQALDELKNLEPENMVGEDELDTLKLVKGFIVEAIVKAHKDAPSYLIDGVKGEQKPAKPEANKDYDFEVSFDSEGKVATIKMLMECVRLASIKASDSNYVVSDYAVEDSPIGRMQLDKYVRGTYDDPRLIIKKSLAESRTPLFDYYTTKDNTATFTLEYVPYPVEESDTFEISEKVEYAVMSLLTAMVLDALSYHDKATLYKNKYQEYLQTAK